MSTWTLVIKATYPVALILGFSIYLSSDLLNNNNQIAYTSKQTLDIVVVTKSNNFS